MYIKISPENKVKDIKNFWNHLHFHPTDAIEDDWGREILDNVAEDNVAQTVRMYAMLEDIVSRGEDGNLKYDFALNDKRIDYMLKKGFNLLISYNFMPPCISSDPNELSTVCKNPTRYKGKFIVTAPPKDWSEWEQVCREYTKHIVERYGLETVSKWYLQCFNEPDLDGFFMKGKDVCEKAENYCKLYDGFEKAARSVSEELTIGGPALAGSMMFFDKFLEHVRKNNRKLDYICFHVYGTRPEYILDGTKPINVYNCLDKVLRIIEICKKHGFKETPLIIDEWGAACAGYRNVEDCPDLMFRETEIFAAYYIKMLTLYDELNLPIDKMLICLSGQHEMKTDFSGFRGFFTLNGYKKPIYNAYALAAKLGIEKIGCVSEAEQNLTVLPTKFDDGHLAIIMSYSSDNFKTPLKDLPIAMEIEGMTGIHSFKKWIIDKDHSNSYSAYLSLGSPDNPSEDVKSKIYEMGSNHCESGETNGKIEMTMTNNSVVLLEIF